MNVGGPVRGCDHVASYSDPPAKTCAVPLPVTVCDTPWTPFTSTTFGEIAIGTCCTITVVTTTGWLVFASVTAPVSGSERVQPCNGAFHVQRGLGTKTSAVSVFSGVRSTAFTLGVRETHWREHVAHMLRGMDPHGPPTLLLDPIAARQFVDRGGFTKKDLLIDWLYDTAQMRAGEYWD